MGSFCVIIAFSAQNHLEAGNGSSLVCCPLLRLGAIFDRVADRALVICYTTYWKEGENPEVSAPHLA
jgi:hypothetical protein